MPDKPGDNTGSSGAAASAPKIIIDSDWKAQAQKERERLAAKEKDEAAKRRPAAPAGPPDGGRGGASGAAGGRAGEPPPMPAADFQALVGTLATQALMYLGAFPDPQTGRAVVSLEYARFHIDMLSVLEEKTRGNLSDQEADDLKQALNELRLRFVEIAKAVEKATREGRVRTSAAGVPGVVGAAGTAGGGLGVGGVTGPGL